MPTKVTWFFHLDVFGWSETHYHVSDDLGQVEFAVDFLTPLRIGILPQPAIVDYIRLSNRDTFRDVQLADPRTDLTKGSTTSQPVKISNYPESALLFRMRGDVPSAQHMVYLRPAPGGSGHDGNRQFIGPSFLTAVGPWRSEMTGFGKPWGFFTSFLAANPQTFIMKVENIAGPGTRVTTAAPHGLGLNDPVRIIGVKDAATGRKPKNTLFRVINPQALSVDLDPPITDVLFYKVSERALIRKVTMGYSKYRSATFIRVVGRQTGRPFASPVGRRRRVI